MTKEELMQAIEQQLVRRQLAQRRKKNPNSTLYSLKSARPN